MAAHVPYKKKGKNNLFKQILNLFKMIPKTTTLCRKKKIIKEKLIKNVFFFVGRPIVLVWNKLQ